MAHLLIIPNSVTNGQSGKCHISGMFSDSDTQGQYSFDAEVEYDDTAATINQAIIDGALYQCGLLNITVGPGDLTRIIGALT